VRLCIDVGIHAQGDRSDHAQFAGDPADEGDLGLALGVEGIDALLQTQLDLGTGFADTGESALARIAAGLLDAEEFPARDDVEARAFLREQVEHGQVRIGLGRVADETVELGPHRAGEAAVVVEDRARAVDVERSAVLGGKGREVDAFAVKRAVLVVEGMHGRAR
jgi:hypothetical protein